MLKHKNAARFRPGMTTGFALAHSCAKALQSAAYSTTKEGRQMQVRVTRPFIMV